MRTSPKPQNWRGIRQADRRCARLRQYRREMVRVITKRGLTAIRDGNEQKGMPKKPILLVSEKFRIQRRTQSAISPISPSKPPSTEKIFLHQRTQQNIAAPAP
jgi:hypothetical protein